MLIFINYYYYYQSTIIFEYYNNTKISYNHGNDITFDSV
jgi:hypothetical protein